MHIKVSLSNGVREQQNLNYLHNEQFYNQKEQKLKISQKPNQSTTRIPGIFNKAKIMDHQTVTS